jgi:hypothetical protein
MVSATGASALQSLARQLKGKVSWQVTEMYPPTVPHIVGSAGYSCHDVGKCVDAAITPPSIDAIHTFLITLDGLAGVSGFEYETCDPDRLRQLQNAPELSQYRNKFKCETTTHGENIHINFTS